jgi:hypothetical protein
MSNSNQVQIGSGLSTSSLLGVLFVGLKLTGYIQWPWVWVLSPFWIPLAIVLALLLAAGFAWALVKILENWK